MLTAIDPWRLAKNAQILRGEFSVAEMPRLLSGLALENTSQGHFEWRFDIAHQKAYIQGHAEVEVQVSCQRCLKPMQLALVSDTLVGLLYPNQTEDILPTGWEPLIIEAVPVSLLDLLEDELILALPLVFRHERCPSNDYQAAEAVAEVPVERENPFAMLAQLKNK